MEKLQYEFLSAMAKAFRAYNKKGGARSTKKLEPIHKFLAKTILHRLGVKVQMK